MVKKGGRKNAPMEIFSLLISFFLKLEEDSDLIYNRIIFPFGIVPDEFVAQNVSGSSQEEDEPYWAISLAIRSR